LDEIRDARRLLAALARAERMSGKAQVPAVSLGYRVLR